MYRSPSLIDEFYHPWSCAVQTGNKSCNLHIFHEFLKVPQFAIHWKCCFPPLWIQQDSTTCGKFWNSCKRWISSCRKICRFVRCATFSTLFKFASSQIRRNLYSIPHVILSLRPWFQFEILFCAYSSHSICNGVGDDGNTFLLCCEALDDFVMTGSPSYDCTDGGVNWIECDSAVMVATVVSCVTQPPVPGNYSNGKCRSFKLTHLQLSVNVQISAGKFGSELETCWHKLIVAISLFVYC